MKHLIAAVMALLSTSAWAQQASTAPGGVLRVLDKITGIVQDIEMRSGEERRIGALTIQFGECRYPTSNPSGDAYELVTILYEGAAEPVFTGWMIASAPAISALEHPRYDVWALRCITS